MLHDRRVLRRGRRAARSRHVAAQAARSGITIYSIDGRGLINGLSANPDVVTRERARDRRRSTPARTAPTSSPQGTGGFMVRNIDDMSRAFGLIVRDTSTYYVIGYQPDNPNDGRQGAEDRGQVEPPGPEGPRPEELRRRRAAAAGSDLGIHQVGSLRSRYRAKG